MELGVDGVILNTAVSKAGDPVAMAEAFGLAVKAGSLSQKGITIEPVTFARPSTPVLGRPFVD
jgi:thiazole synthase